MLPCVCGNVIISLAWFGAGIMANSSGLHAYGMANYWPLAVIMGLHLLILGMGMRREPTVAEA